MSQEQRYPQSNNNNNYVNMTSYRTTVVMLLIKMDQHPRLITESKDKITTHMAPIRMHNMEKRNNPVHARPVVPAVWYVECAVADSAVVPVS